MNESRLVCVVDDDASVRDSLSIMLGLKGFDCRTYESSEAFLSASPDKPCCLVLDLNMAGMSGLDLQEKLGHLHRPVEVIFLTAFADVDVMRRAFLNQAVDFLENQSSCRCCLTPLNVRLSGSNLTLWRSFGLSRLKH